ncbi:MAG: amidohydrolase family protein [Candidatus Altiarchaeota archaeon]|nr:amidohydrolase family protein [Candidatus Altiarchaeota archaeon]
MVEAFIVDCHAHIYPDEVAAKVVPRIEEVYGAKAAHPATVEGILSAMDSGGIDKSLILSSINRPEHVVSFNDWCAETQRSNPHLLFFGGLHPTFENPLDELERIKELGLFGIKLQPNAHRFYPDDERFFPIYERLSELDLGLAFHCGDEVLHFEPMYAHPMHFTQVLESFPDLVIQLAHLGGYKTWDSLHCVTGYRNVWYDTAFCPRNLPDKDFLSVVDEIGLERVIFGTDFPWTDPGRERKELERILGEDAVKILSDNPRQYLSLLV